MILNQFSEVQKVISSQRHEIIPLSGTAYSAYFIPSKSEIIPFWQSLVRRINESLVAGRTWFSVIQCHTVPTWMEFWLARRNRHKTCSSLFRTKRVYIRIFRKSYWTDPRFDWNQEFAERRYQSKFNCRTLKQ